MLYITLTLFYNKLYYYNTTYTFIFSISFLKSYEILGYFELCQSLLTSFIFTYIYHNKTNVISK